MHRTGFEHFTWHIIKGLKRDRLAAPALVGLWFVGWLALVLTLFAPAA